MSTLAATNLKHESSASNNIVLTSGGDVGIGTSSVTYQLTVQGTGQDTANLTDAGNKGGSLFLRATAVTSGSGGALLFGTTFGNQTPFAALKGLVTDGTSNTIGDLAFSTRNAFGDTSLTERMRIDSSGNVLIGTTSAIEKLTVAGNARMALIYGNRGSGEAVTAGGFGLTIDGSIQAQIVSPASNSMAFYTNSTERARITSDGNLQIGTTTDRGRATISWNSLSQQGLSLITTSTTFNGSPIVFYNSSAGVSGFIGQAAGSVTYNTSSDYRLKHDVQPLAGGLATVAALKPSTYKWNADNSPGEGFIAHELQAIIPQAVSGEKDAMNDDGSINPQGVDYSKVVVHLVAAIQELKADFDAYKAAHP
jgi:hypothetical protein